MMIDSDAKRRRCRAVKCRDDDGKRLPTNELQGFPVRLFDPFLLGVVRIDELYTSMCFVTDFVVV